MNLLQAYRRERAPIFARNMDTGAPVECRQRAGQALRDARIRVAWDAAGGYEAAEYELGPGGLYSGAPDEPGERVRLILRDDPDPSSALDGDYSERQLAELRERIERDGVCGVAAQFWNGAEWISVDSVWGFIGDDWRRSGYDTDLMSAALDALAEHDAASARDAEAARPDLYTQH